MRTFRRYLVQTQEQVSCFCFEVSTQFHCPVLQYEFCYTTILHATKFYRDGSRQLQNKAKQPTAAAVAAPQPSHSQPDTPVEPAPSTASSHRDEVRALVQSATAGLEPQETQASTTLPPPPADTPSFALEPSSAAAATVVSATAARYPEADDTVVQVSTRDLDAVPEPNPADAPSGSVNAAPSNTRPTIGNSKPVWLHVCTKAEANQLLLGAGKNYTQGRFLVYMDNMKRGLLRLDSNNKVVHAQVKSSSSGLGLGK
jgi:hypothetical protein